jgi:hypothetical protein
MKVHRPPTHRRRSTSPGLTTTAGAIVALVAIAATMTAAPSAHATIVETRSSLADTKTVRAVAAAMVAVARELAGKDRVDSSLPVIITLDSGIAPSDVLIVHRDDRAHQPRAHLSERLLDLPPPGC